MKFKIRSDLKYKYHPKYKSLQIEEQKKEKSSPNFTDTHNVINLPQALQIKYALKCYIFYTDSTVAIVD
jgi:hypothetical protein